jgi:hypothetical protein
MPETGADFTENKGVRSELLDRHSLPPGEDVVRRNNQHHSVAGEMVELQMGVLGLSANQTEAHLPPFNLCHHRHAVANCGMNSDVRVLFSEDREQGREKMLPGDGAGGDEQFPREGRFMSRDVPKCRSVKVENLLGEVIEALAVLRKQHPTALPLEEGFAETFFKGLDTETDRRLRHAERPGRAGETVQLSSLREGFQIG